MKLKELPDFFALEHLAKALWRDGESRGAALLLGSGFSRFARLPAGNSKRPPLWGDLKRSMLQQIYPDTPESEIPTDPLRMAEEFRAMLGQAALDDFIRVHVTDQSWEPGELHERLLRLPWADVLTTNWDTLLERAALRVGDIAYESVIAPNDIARARPPRIVKLHGTLPSGPFIFAEEDYRTYPTRSAAFVNLARQVFLENELCLLGFSGNDPNFLQWSGWVRDHLGGGARRIYLVGVLNLHAATRRLLEQRNVAPIDLAPLFEDADPSGRHEKATRLFLEHLQSAEPMPLHAWSPGRSPNEGRTTEEINRRMKDKKYSAEILLADMERWKSERQSYPGWLICPSEKRSLLRHMTTDITLGKEVISMVDQKKRARFLYELAWRFDRAFWSMPEHIFELIYDAVSSHLNGTASNASDEDKLSQEEWLELGSIALRVAREANDSPKFEGLTALLLKHSEEGSDHRAHVAYQQSLSLRDRLNFSELVKSASAIEGPDPAWKLRQANIRSEFGDFETARELIFDALDALRTRQQRDRQSLWVLSRRAWAEYLARAVDLGAPSQSKKDFSRGRDWPLEFKAVKCDPWDELRYVEHRLDEELRDHEKPSFDLKPHFDAGTFSEGGQGARFRSWTIGSPSYEFNRLAEEAGLPVVLDRTSIRSEDSKKALVLSCERTEAWYLRLFQTVRSHTDELLDRFLDRLSVARLDNGVALSLLNACIAAVNFWRTRATFQKHDTATKSFDGHAIEQLRFFLELTSRLVIRCDQTKARELYALALVLIKDSDLRHWWLLAPIGHLLQRAVEATPPGQKGDFALEALQFPLLGEAGYQGPEHDWPRPLEDISNAAYVRPADSTAWTSRIADLLQAVRSDKQIDRSDASLRLCRLHEKGLLTPEEQTDFGQALYSHCDADGLPEGTDLFSFVFLSLPAVDKDMVRQRFTELNFERVNDRDVTYDWLVTIKGATHKYRADDPALLPTHEEALAIADAVLEWRPKSPDLPFNFDRSKAKQIGREIGPTLVYAVAPLLTSDDLTDARIESMFRSLYEAPAPSILQLLPVLLPLRPAIKERVVKAIRRALMDSRYDYVWSAAHALQRWAALVETAGAIPESLIDQLLIAIHARQEAGLYGLLHCGRQLVRLGQLSSAQHVALAEALSDLFAQVSYQSELPQALRVSLSIVRAECVRVAKELADRGLTGEGISVWLDAYKNDPLPEVRFALEDTERGVWS